MKLIDDGSPRQYKPSKTETHHSVLVGSALVIPFIPLDARGIMIQAIADEVRYTLDGTVPTAAFGFRLLLTSKPTFIELNELVTLQLFGEGATSAVEYQIFE